MDAPVHTAFRAINDKYFTPERPRKFAPVIREAVQGLIADLPRGEEVDVMQGFRPGLRNACAERLHGLARMPRAAPHRVDRKEPRRHPAP